MTVWQVLLHGRLDRLANDYEPSTAINDIYPPKEDTDILEELKLEIENKENIPGADKKMDNSSDTFGSKDGEL